MRTNTAYLLLGSNQGDRMKWLQQAVSLLSAQCGTVVQQSGTYQTAAWGITDQPAFLNKVVLLQTTLTPTGLLAEIHDIETALGRQRDVKWGQRTLDIDILLYNSEVIQLPDLIIPHPYMQERRFTLVPLAKIAPDYVHPKLNKSINDLLEKCPDKLDVIQYINNISL